MPVNSGTLFDWKTTGFYPRSESTTNINQPIDSISAITAYLPEFLETLVLRR